MVGYTTSPDNGSKDVLLIKLNSEGEEVWSQTYGGDSNDEGISLLRVNNGYIIAGTTYSFGSGSSDYYLIRTDNEGEMIWSRTFGGQSVEVCKDVICTENNEYVLAGATASFGGGNADFWIVKTGQDPNANVKDILHSPRNFQLLTLHPNPFNSVLTINCNIEIPGEIRWSVLNSKGQLIDRISSISQSGSQTMLWDAENHSGGTYFIMMESPGRKNVYQKAILLK